MFMILKKGLGIRFGSYVEGSTAIDRSNTLSISANYTFPINIFQLYIYIYIYIYGFVANFTSTATIVASRSRANEILKCCV